MGRKKSVKEEMRVRRLRQHKLGMNGSQLINPEKCNFWKENLFTALDQRFQSLVGKQIFEQLSNFLTQPHSCQIDAFSCWIQLSGPTMALRSKGEQRGNNCFSLPPATCDLLQVFCHLFRWQCQCQLWVEAAQPNFCYLGVPWAHQTQLWSLDLWSLSLVTWLRRDCGKRCSLQKHCQYLYSPHP